MFLGDKNLELNYFLLADYTSINSVLESITCEYSGFPSTLSS
jgi:hypothetical protein